jgi:hypothetical protein
VLSHCPPNYSCELTKLRSGRSWRASHYLGRLPGFPFREEHPDEQIIGALLAWILLEDFSKQLDSLHNVTVITFELRQAHHNIDRITGTIQCVPQNLPRLGNPTQITKTVGPCAYPGGSVVPCFRSL